MRTLKTKSSAELNLADHPNLIIGKIRIPESPVAVGSVSHFVFDIVIGPKHSLSGIGRTCSLSQTECNEVSCNTAMMHVNSSDNFARLAICMPQIRYDNTVNVQVKWACYIGLCKISMPSETE